MPKASDPLPKPADVPATCPKCGKSVPMREISDHECPKEK